MHRRRRVAAAGGGANVEWVSDGASAGGGTNNSASYTDLTVGSGANRVMIAHLVTSSTIVSPSMVWDSVGANQTMTLIRSQQMATWSKFIYTFGLVAPASGNKTLSVAWTNNVDWIVQASDFINADQTGGTTTFANATGGNGTSTTPATTVTSADGDIAIAAATWDGGGGSSSARSHTQMFEGSHSIGSFGASQRAAGAASVAFTWTVSSIQWGVNGFTIKKA
jgi:hypothetical protein